MRPIERSNWPPMKSAPGTTAYDRERAKLTSYAAEGFDQRGAANPYPAGDWRADEWARGDELYRSVREHELSRGQP